MIKKISIVFLSLITFITCAKATDNEALANKLSNPIAAMVSIPIQINYDYNIGKNNGKRILTNFQPVVPFHITKDYNLITRIVIPIIRQIDVTGIGENQTMLGNSLLSLFVSPVNPIDGWIIGAGLAVNLPTSTNSDVIKRVSSVGPTAVVLRQANGFTVGALANHLVSFAGYNHSSKVNGTYFQPFISYTTSGATTYSLESETTYDWENSKVDIPINMTVGQMLKVAGKTINITGGVRYWAKSEITQTNSLGFRIALTLLLPQ